MLGVGYFGTRFHQPRLLGLASACLALGSLTLSLPHFITPDYQPRGSADRFCIPAGKLHNAATNYTTHPAVSISMYSLRGVKLCLIYGYRHTFLTLSDENDLIICYFFQKPSSSEFNFS